ncbi:MAG: hypothetical protein IH591_05945 [Bacteroidales bacterium]|nr:hypothetical protein [Bacteroidales bacterium]
MQQLRNNGLYEFPTERGKGVVGTILFHIVLITILVAAGFTSSPPETEEGLLVNFGTDDFGMGLIEPSQSLIEESAPIPEPVNPVTSPVQEKQIDTQEFDEEAPVVKKVTQPDPEAEKKRLEAIEAEKRRQQELEAERKRIEAEELERKRIEEEQRRIQEASDRTRNALTASRNTGTTSTGEGNTTGTGNQGVTTGSVDSKLRGIGSGYGTDGTGWSLEGRSVQEFPLPKYDYQGEGKVVVEVTVDRTGKVIFADPGKPGSTTLDEYLLRVAKDAALLARFDSNPEAPLTQRGTITYVFILK